MHIVWCACAEDLVFSQHFTSYRTLHSMHGETYGDIHSIILKEDSNFVTQFACEFVVFDHVRSSHDCEWSGLPHVLCDTICV